MSTPTLRIAHESIGRALVVHFGGEVDLNTAPDLQEGLDQALARARPPDIVVADLSKVEFMGSTGLAVLMGIDRRCRDQHTPLRIVAAAPGVVRPLEVTGLDRVLNVVGSLDSVIQSA